MQIKHNVNKYFIGFTDFFKAVVYVHYTKVFFQISRKFKILLQNSLKKIMKTCWRLCWCCHVVTSRSNHEMSKVFRLNPRDLLFATIELEAFAAACQNENPHLHLEFISEKAETWYQKKKKKKMTQILSQKKMIPKTASVPNPLKSEMTIK